MVYSKRFLNTYLKIEHQQGQKAPNGSKNKLNIWHIARTGFSLSLQWNHKKLEII